MAERWPLLMDRGTACRYLTFTRHQFEALMASGAFPKPVEPVAGSPRWSRHALDRAVERMDQRETTIDYAREREDTRQALLRLREAQVRGGDQGPPRRGVPVLSARRPKDTSAGA